ncbi:hypothetical protein HZH66_010949 [Vespula vulgaris]|uniref:HMG box domain-containing protein n=1 Tax=Vespula vulgaris TaxID=7454 RepID=A0A834JJB5_VESVU|nr:hypothetical protein HZH66_010949 [Vespula vulgaris]
MAGFGRLVSPGFYNHFLNARCLLTGSYQFVSTKVIKQLENEFFPNKPKKPLTPFFKYMKIMRPSIVNKFPGYKSSDIVKELSARWALEDPEYKFKLNKEYDTEYKEYMVKLIEFEKTITPEQRENYMNMRKNINKRKESKEDVTLLGKPKRPPSAFILYMLNQMKVQKPVIKTKEYLKQLSIQWNTMNERDKQQFIDQAGKLMDQYNKEKVEWKQNKIKESHKKVFNNNIVGWGTEIPDSSIDIATYKYFIGQNSIIYKYLLKHSQLHHNLYSISTYMVKSNVIKNDLMTHAHENYLLQIDKSKNVALVHYLQSNTNKTLSDPNTFMNNVKVHISKSEEQNEKLQFHTKILKNLTKNWDTVKKHI